MCVGLRLTTIPPACNVFDHWHEETDEFLVRRIIPRELSNLITHCDATIIRVGNIVCFKEPQSREKGGGAPGEDMHTGNEPMRRD